MREIARHGEGDRRDLFRATAQAMHVHEAIVEKDFWVCWTLDYLFQDSPWKDQLAFKGGTSLSKAFGAIERFSEDIDLVLDWRVLGYTDEDAWDRRSATKQDAFGKEANERTAAFLAGEFLSTLGPVLTERANSDVGVAARGQDVLITYPRAFSLAAIQPQIRLEIGPLAAWVPNEERTIRPYAAERYPSVFSQPQTTARTIAGERTYWEKVTILHQEAHRSVEKAPPARYSRHYYDLYRLSRMPLGERSLGRLELLDEVVRFKMRFYRCPWARYEDARPGSLRLLPRETYLSDLQKDYADMQAMLFGDIPAFETIVSELSALEKNINHLKAPES